jgi:hypothetical protein
VRASASASDRADGGSGVSDRGAADRHDTRSEERSHFITQWQLCTTVDILSSVAQDKRNAEGLGSQSPRKPGTYRLVAFNLQ